MAVSVALIGLALPTMTSRRRRGARRRRGLAPVPANVTVVHQAITTSFDVTLAPRGRAALADYIASLSDTASANYRHFLTTEAVRAALRRVRVIGDAVRDYFEGFGLHVGSLSRGRLVLHVKGTTTEIAHAFAARVDTLRRSNGDLVAQLATKGTVPVVGRAHIAGVAGLSSVVQPSTNLVARTRQCAHRARRRPVPTTAARPRRRPTPTAATRPSSSPSSTVSTRCGRTTSPERVRPSPSTN
jgi:kumamolisin